jgi:hypothetical protein
MYLLLKINLFCGPINHLHANPFYIIVYWEFSQRYCVIAGREGQRKLYINIHGIPSCSFDLVGGQDPFPRRRRTAGLAGLGT